MTKPFFMNDLSLFYPSSFPSKQNQYEFSCLLFPSSCHFLDVHVQRLENFVIGRVDVEDVVEAAETIVLCRLPRVVPPDSVHPELVGVHPLRQVHDCHEARLGGLHRDQLPVIERPTQEHLLRPFLATILKINKNLIQAKKWKSKFINRGL